jgi:small subunit ribosomal protein S4
MVVSLKPQSQQLKIVLLAQENLQREIPSYLELEESKVSGKLLATPQVDQIPIPIPINIPLVCEFLSHTN